MFLGLRLKIIHFYRRNKKKIYIIAIAIGIIIAINTYLGYLKSIEPPSTSYKPHNPVIYGDEVTDNKTKESIEEVIKTYINYCNQKDYSSAFNCLTDECKKYRFNNSMKEFRTYIDAIFNEKRTYSIQDLSNKDNVYVYQLKLTEDMLATGLNNEHSGAVYEEYIVFTKDGNNFKFAVDGYIKSEKLNMEYEDEYMKVIVKEKNTTYDTVTYTFTVENKTKYDIVFANTHDDKEFALSLQGDYRIFKEDAYYEEVIAVYDGGEGEFSVTFNKYFDESRKESELIFNKIRILKNYSGVEEKWEKEIEKPIKEYSITFPLE